MCKLINSLGIATRLVLARTFGEYVHSGWDGTRDYCKYRWRGRVYLIPTSHDENDY